MTEDEIKKRFIKKIKYQNGLIIEAKSEENYYSEYFEDVEKHQFSIMAIVVRFRKELMKNIEKYKNRLFTLEEVKECFKNFLYLKDVDELSLDIFEGGRSLIKEIGISIYGQIGVKNGVTNEFDTLKNGLSYSEEEAVMRAYNLRVLEAINLFASRLKFLGKNKDTFSIYQVVYLLTEYCIDLTQKFNEHDKYLLSTHYYVILDQIRNSEIEWWIIW